MKRILKRMEQSENLTANAQQDDSITMDNGHPPLTKENSNIDLRLAPDADRLVSTGSAIISHSVGILLLARSQINSRDRVYLMFLSNIYFIFCRQDQMKRLKSLRQSQDTSEPTKTKPSHPTEPAEFTGYSTSSHHTNNNTCTYGDSRCASSGDSRCLTSESRCVSSDHRYSHDAVEVNEGASTSAQARVVDTVKENVSSLFTKSKKPARRDDGKKRHYRRRRGSSSSNEAPH